MSMALARLMLRRCVIYVEGVDMGRAWLSSFLAIVCFGFRERQMQDCVCFGLTMDARMVRAGLFMRAASDCADSIEGVPD